MPWRTHLFLMIAAEFLGFALAAALGIALFIRRTVSDSLPVNALLLGGLVLIGVMIPRTLMRRVIGARCPTDRCPGPARPAGVSPILYRCARCGWTRDSGVSEDTRHTHHELHR
ncbi:MAG: hypothetical protein ACF8SC_11365 [Phycisphaerales bacterium JB037]